MKDLYEEYLNWLAELLNSSYEYDFEGRFIDQAEFTEAEYEEFMELLEKHKLVVITELGWNKCKEKITY